MTRPLPTQETEPHDLRSAEHIKKLFARYASEPVGSVYKLWQNELVTFLRWVADAPISERASREFQQRLWDENKISAVGRGSISVDAALNDASFREWLATTSVAPLPVAPNEILSYLHGIYTEIIERLKPYCAKSPRLKILRVMAALYPKNFTTIADRSVLMRLHKSMFEGTGGSSVGRHLNIVHRLEEVLGPVPSDLPALVERMTFAWYLAERIDVEENRPLGPPGSETLVPLPAMRRRRGLTGTGNIGPVISALEYVREGVTRDELVAYLRSQEPGKKDSSHQMTINVLRQELHVVRRDGDRYLLTPTGESLLESEDPSILAPWFLTQVLGVDLALVSLRDEGNQTRSDLVAKIKTANPGWKTDWTPIAIVNWLQGIGLLSITPDRMVMLTDLGKHWASRIDWVPPRLPPEEVVEPLSTVVADNEPSPSVALPAFERIYKRIVGAGHFDRQLVLTLHAGIWGHSRRHFAIMTGLSGAGKTLLAIEYGKAITDTNGVAEQVNRFCVVPVQPGWTDASALLGYVNPLRGDTYVRMPFLDFLLACESDPGRPYVALLDEMNLSHPEQYLAPLLSAMETGGYVELHREDDVFDGVPTRIKYPNNLVLIGTVNMDETTHGLSDKVLDRAFTLEFWNIDVDAYPGWNKRNIPKDAVNLVRETLKSLVEALSPARLHFGWRVIEDVLDFMQRAIEIGLGTEPVSALDAVVYAKVIPKLRGDDSDRFRVALESCHKILDSKGLKRSAVRVQDLIHDLKTTGTARFWR